MNVTDIAGDVLAEEEEEEGGHGRRGTAGVGVTGPSPPIDEKQLWQAAGPTRAAPQRSPAPTHIPAARRAATTGRGEEEEDGQKDGLFRFVWWQKLPPPPPRPGPRQSLFVVSVAAATAMKKWNAAAGAACDGRAGGAEEITWASGRLAGRRRWRRSLSHVGE